MPVTLLAELRSRGRVLVPVCIPIRACSGPSGVAIGWSAWLAGSAAAHRAAWALQQRGKLRVDTFAAMLEKAGVRQPRVPRVPLCLHCGGAAPDAPRRVHARQGDTTGWLCGPRCAAAYFQAQELPAADAPPSAPPPIPLANETPVSMAGSETRASGVANETQLSTGGIETRVSITETETQVSFEPPELPPRPGHANRKPVSVHPRAAGGRARDSQPGRGPSRRDRRACAAQCGARGGSPGSNRRAPPRPAATDRHSSTARGK
jgi:hypothetical protein